MHACMRALNCIVRDVSASKQATPRTSRPSKCLAMPGSDFKNEFQWSFMSACSDLVEGTLLALTPAQKSTTTQAGVNDQSNLDCPSYTTAALLLCVRYGYQLRFHRNLRRLQAACTSTHRVHSGPSDMQASARVARPPAGMHDRPMC